MTIRKGTLAGLLVATIGLVLSPSHALAYIGPGAGLSAIGSLLALIAVVVVSVFGFIWYPLKRALRLLKSKREVGTYVALSREEPL